MRGPGVVLVALAALGMTAGAGLDLQQPTLTRERMESALAPGARFLFVYGTKRPESTAGLRAAALRMARGWLGRDSTLVRADREVSADSLATRSVVLLGTPSENSWTERLAPGLPVSFTARGFRWFDRAYERPLDVIRLVYPNPIAPTRFLLLVAANSPPALDSRFGLAIGEEDWRIDRDGALTRSGHFAQSDAAPWRYDPALDQDLEREREQYATRLRARTGRGIVWLAPPADSRADGFCRSAEALLVTLDRRGFRAPDSAPVRVTAYASLEEKGRLTRNTRPEHVAARREVAIALPAGRTRPDLWSVAGVRLVALGASPDSRDLEPAGAWLAGRWGGESLDRAIARLYFARLLPTAREAALRRATWRSPLILVPARAALLGAILDCAGDAAPARASGADPHATALLALLDGRAPGTLDSLCLRAGVAAPRVERRYAVLVDSLARIGRRDLADGAPRLWRPADGFMRGVCLAHAVSLERGYLSASCARELERLRSLPADWVSISPFGYVPGPDVAEIYASADGGADEETDEAVIEAAARARSLGLRVLLAPHLWTRGWTGTLEFGASRWPQFFDRYREFLLHYAVLAEREGMAGLVVGHELGSATARDPDRWRTMIGEVRRVYEGTVTYSANWDHEVESIPFWDACDLIGVSFYQPLAVAAGASGESQVAAARRALATLKALAKRTGRPVLLTEAGYASVPGAALKPWEEPRGGPVDVAAQRDAWDALLTALDSEEWVAGVFAWKWFSAPPSAAASDRSFSPQGKPAQALIAQRYAAWRDRPVRPLTRAP